MRSPVAGWTRKSSEASSVRSRRPRRICSTGSPAGSPDELPRSRWGAAPRAAPTAAPIVADTRTSSPYTGTAVRRRLPDDLRERVEAAVRVHVGADHHELVAGVPGGAAAGREALAQPLGQVDEQLVAGVVAQRVVDPLEVVEVAEQDRGPAGRRALRAGATPCGVSARRLGRPVSSSCMAWWRSDASTRRVLGDVGEDDEVGGGARASSTDTETCSSHQTDSVAVPRAPRSRRCSARAAHDQLDRAGRPGGAGEQRRRRALGGEVEELVGAASAQRLLTLPSSRHSDWLACTRRSWSSKIATPTGATASRSVNRCDEVRRRVSIARRSVTSSTDPRTITVRPPTAVRAPRTCSIRVGSCEARTSRSSGVPSGSSSESQRAGRPWPRSAGWTHSASEASPKVPVGGAAGPTARGPRR